MKEDIKPVKLKPVVYTSNYFKRCYQNTSQQMFLLKALQITKDPKKLKELIGVKTVAEVYRTLDKMSMRKEYHDALARKGISFDYMLDGIKGIADNGEKDADRLKAFQTLLKSVGMDKYDDENSTGTGTWEEVLLQKIEEDKVDGIEEPKKLDKYEVKKPVMPESVRKAKEEEAKITSSVYDS